MIIEQTYDLIKKQYIKNHEDLIISDCRVGSYLTAVRLSDGSTGTASTLNEIRPVCAKPSRDFGEFSPLKIKGQKVISLLDTTKGSGIISSLKTAVLNALSSKIIARGNYNIIENCDPVQLLEFTPDKTVTLVGAFQSYIRKISPVCNKLFVLEQNKNALTSEQMKLYFPDSEYKRIIPDSDIIIITGQTLVNKTIDDILSVVRPGARVIVTGPSANILPDILFQNNVSLIGGFRITRPDILFDLVSEGGMGYHLFEYCAQKICIKKW